MYYQQIYIYNICIYCFSFHIIEIKWEKYWTFKKKFLMKYKQRTKKEAEREVVKVSTWPTGIKVYLRSQRIIGYGQPFKNYLKFPCFCFRHWFIYALKFKYYKEQVFPDSTYFRTKLFLITFCWGTFHL